VAQMGVRMDCCARIYGWRFAALAPLRIFWANTINCAATILALWQFLLAGAARRTLVWTKTEHVYLGHTADDTVRRRLGEVLVRIGCISMRDLEEALSSVPKGVRLGEHLFHTRKIREEDLYRALSIHHGIPLGKPAASEINPAVTRAFPAAVARRCKAMPFRVAAGHLHVATTDLPSRESALELARHSTLSIRFRLVMPKDFEDLAGEYLPRTVDSASLAVGS
jgi:Type II secretion system (T2SS), protein E, N-terminal domain